MQYLTILLTAVLCVSLSSGGALAGDKAKKLELTDQELDAVSAAALRTTPPQDFPIDLTTIAAIQQAAANAAKEGLTKPNVFIIYESVQNPVKFAVTTARSLRVVH